MATYKVLTLTLSDGSGAFRLNERQILKVLSSSQGTIVQYVEDQMTSGIRKTITVDETPSAIDTATQYIFPIDVAGQQAYYINNEHIRGLDDNSDGVCVVYYDNAGQNDEAILTLETEATIATRINALT